MDEDQVFEAEAIRDTSNHNSNESFSGEYLAKTIFIENGLDESVTFQLQGSRNSVWVDIGTTFVVANATNDYQTVDAYFPKYRLQAICSSAPTTGNLDVWIIKAR